MRCSSWKCSVFSYWLIAFFVVSLSLLEAQTLRYSFHSLTTEDGLSQASNDFVYHDSKGFIWLSSLDGLNRYDGQSVKVYKSIPGDSTSLLDNIITSNFYEDAQSNLWFTTYQGIHCYLRERDHFRHFQLKGPDGQLRQQDYHAFYLDAEGRLWLRIGIDGSGHLHQFDTRGLEQEILGPLDGQRNYPLIDAEGNVQQIVSSLFSQKRGLEMRSVARPAEVTSFLDGQGALPNVYVHQVLAGSGKALYLATDQGLFAFDVSDQSVQQFTDYKGEPIGKVYGLCRMNDSVLWVTSTQQSVLQFNERRLRFTGQIPIDPDAALGLHLQPANKIYLDVQENLWLSSFSGGIQFANLKKRKFQLPELFVGQPVFQLFEDLDRQIYISYGRGALAQFNPDSKTYESLTLAIPTAMRPEGIQFFFRDRSGQLQGLTTTYRLVKEEGNGHFEYAGQLPAPILYFYQSPGGLNLLSTYSGLFEWKDGAFSPFQGVAAAEQILATAIFQDSKGRLYFALNASQLKVFEQKGGRYEAIRQIDGIGYANAFYETDSVLWVATSTGLLKLNTQDFSSRLLNEKEDGIPSEYFYSVLPDEAGQLWLSCNRGIIRYSAQTGSMRRFTLADGLQSNEFNTNAYLRSQSGELWLGGIRGLNRFNPKQLQDLDQLPQIQLTGLQVNDEPYQTDIQVGALQRLQLPYKQNTISFTFAALEYSDPKNNHFRYQLYNHESSWVDAGTRGFARYSNLPPGQYRFLVQAANSDGRWNETPYQLDIHIQTPWWMSWWFYLLVALSLAAIIFSISRYRLQQALKIERMRVKISSDLHDDVGSLLAGLAMQSELLEATASEERRPKLARIGELSRSAMSRMRDTVWAIDARKDKLENLLDRIREHAMETLELKGIGFSLEVDNLALSKPLNSQVRQNLYLICKEAITNATKHSTGDAMRIHFDKHGRNGLLITIHDNGEVAQKAYKTTGLGMSNMQMRAEQIQARLEIDTSDGFKIQLWM